jgi:hypothetical protein
MTLTASPPFRAVPAQQSPPYACRHGLAISRWVKGTVSSHMAWSCSSRECLACQHLHGVSCAAAVALSDIDLRTDCTPLPGRLIMMSIIRCWRSIVLRRRSSMAMSSRSGSECCTLFAAFVRCQTSFHRADMKQPLHKAQLWAALLAIQAFKWRMLRVQGFAVYISVLDQLYLTPCCSALLQACSTACSYRGGCQACPCQS